MIITTPPDAQAMTVATGAGLTVRIELDTIDDLNPFATFQRLVRFAFEHSQHPDMSPKLNEYQAEMIATLETVFNSMFKGPEGLSDEQFEANYEFEKNRNKTPLANTPSGYPREDEAGHRPSCHCSSCMGHVEYSPEEMDGNDYDDPNLYSAPFNIEQDGYLA